MADLVLSTLTEATTVALTDYLLMKVGANSRKVKPDALAAAIFPLLGMAAGAPVSASDLNALTETKLYQISAADAPTGNAPEIFTCFCFNAKLDSNRIVQFAMVPANGHFWWRTRSNAMVWSTWQRALEASLVQTSTTDNVTGHLLTVGAFGTGGGSAIVNDNFDTIADNGFYRTSSSSATGVPIPGSGSWICEHIQISSTTAIQLAHRATALTGRHYVRTKSSSVWGAWETLFSNGNLLGTVSMDGGGAPNGAIIQSGSNANGAYLKFASGDMICSTADRTVANASTADGALFKSADVNWTFPSAFITPPVLSAAGVDDLDCFVTTKLPVSATVGTARIKSTVSKSTTITFGLVARGRWTT